MSTYYRPSFPPSTTPRGVIIILQQRPFGAESDYEKQQQQQQKLAPSQTMDSEPRSVLHSDTAAAPRSVEPHPDTWSCSWGSSSYPSSMTSFLAEGSGGLDQRPSLTIDLRLQRTGPTSTTVSHPKIEVCRTMKCSYIL